jgi:hypothetical protein
MTRKEVALALNCSTEKVARMEEQDLLPSIRLGHGPQAPVRYRPEDVAVVRERGLEGS